MSALAATSKDNAQIVTELEKLTSHMRQVVEVLADYDLEHTRTPAEIVRQKLIDEARATIAPAYTQLCQAILGAGLTAMDFALAEAAQKRQRSKQVAQAIRDGARSVSLVKD